MILKSKTILTLAILAIATSQASWAASGAKLKQLSEQPGSGKAREAGFDGRHGMEDTGLHNSLAKRCAQASRGIIILDNKTWKRCGFKTKGVGSGPARAEKKSSNHGHMNH